MKSIEIKVYNIAKDGLPNDILSKEAQTGRIGFLWDGNIYSGWPLYPNHSSDKSVWEDSEFAHKLSGVEDWVLFPRPFWDLKSTPAETSIQDSAKSDTAETSKLSEETLTFIDRWYDDRSWALEQLGGQENKIISEILATAGILKGRNG